ncbi:protein CYTOKININ-RESPONSIVE GATA TRANSCRIPTION FACTOR 1 [Cocos nucifera]|uniref:Protein CYTOKININ-RESPONSIVE GATA TRANSCRIPTION FACTOR 1 n=1 Tax=Cocos nucifera TaxID=13894 RepID=A0A8K0ITZ1_COCNU|nr:protein CYTOKININ-RESPONSIVE GATA TRANSCRIPTION FACTOR 1 [Cocos nucifera]
MFPSNLKQYSSLPLKKRNQDQSHPSTSTPATNYNLCPCPAFFGYTIEDQGANGGKRHGHQYHQQRQQEKPNESLLINGSNDFLQSFSANSNNNNNDKMGQFFCDGAHNEDGHGSVEWMSSKMHRMREMTGSEQTVTSKPRRSMEDLQEKKQQNQDSSSNFPSSIIRVCSDCSTTKTPLWRSGPQGPKSLCNACGIRQRKARQAMSAAAGSGLMATNTLGKVRKGKKADGDRTNIPNKNRCKITNTGTAQKKLQIDDLTTSLSDDSAFHHVFPQDEKDAAILLMALSCGPIHG